MSRRVRPAAAGRNLASAVRDAVRRYSASIPAAAISFCFEAKKLKALAIGRQSRLPSHPEIPTLREAGFPDIEPLSWFGLFAPAGTPPAIVEKIQKAVAATLADPEFKARFIDRAGHSGVGSTPAEFAAFIKADFDSKKRLIAAAGIEAE